VIIFGSVFIKKNNKLILKKKTETEPNQFKSTGFGLTQFFLFCSILAWFFRFGFGSVF
jgi:hypothetical protein